MDEKECRRQSGKTVNQRLNQSKGGRATVRLVILFLSFAPSRAPDGPIASALGRGSRVAEILQ
jgi:hypothetical protein